MLIPSRRSFTQETVPDAAIAAAVEAMRGGGLHAPVSPFDALDAHADACPVFSTGELTSKEPAHRSSAASVPLKIGQLGKEKLTC